VIDSVLYELARIRQIEVDVTPVFIDGTSSQYELARAGHDCASGLQNSVTAASPAHC